MNQPSQAPNVIQGHYYEKQIACKSHAIAWCHASRFEKASKLIGKKRIQRLLDYGCGDGTMLTMIADRADECWGADIEDYQLADCRKRLNSLSNTRFCNVSELRGSDFKESFDLVLCMETLEHCLDEIASRVLDDLAFLCRPDGRVIISVPIETGPTFLLKKSIRTLAAWRGLSDYRYYESYSFRNALRMMFASTETALERPAYGPLGSQHHSHYGFNWKQMRQKVGKVFEIERTNFSPLASLAGFVSSQAWFICRPKIQK